MAKGDEMMPTILIPWFLWSMVYPGGAYAPLDIVAQPVKEFPSKALCEEGLRVYKVEVDKAFPPPKGGNFIVTPWVELKCSPVYPG